MFQEKLLTLTLTWLGMYLVLANAEYFGRRGHFGERRSLPYRQAASEFGYRVQNKDQQSSHFRQEHRDENGVVRGSYGLRDVDGTFRLVRYIADEKGFRADVTSNEPGVGRQNPASINLRKTTNFQTESKNMFASVPEMSHRNFPKVQDQEEYQSDSPGESGPLDLRKYLSNYPFFDDPSQSDQENPASDVVWKDYNGNVYGNRDSSKDISAKSDERIRNGSPNWNFQSNDFSKSKSAQDWSLKTRDGLQTTNDDTYSERNYQKSRFIPDSEQLTPGVLNIILKQPQQKVHRNLPDCDTVNSGVLCEPPKVNRNRIVEDTSSDNDFLETLKVKDDIGGSYPTSQLIENTFADRLYKFSVSSDNGFPFRSSRNDVATNRDVFKYFPSLKVPSNTKSSCRENRNPVDENSNDEISPALNQPVIYNSISNTHINSYGENWRNFKPQNIPSQQQYTSPDFGARRHDSSSNQQVILLSPQSSQDKNDSSALKFLERLNVIGVILVNKDNEFPKNTGRATDIAELFNQSSEISKSATDLNEDNRNMKAVFEKDPHIPSTSQNSNRVAAKVQTFENQHNLTNTLKNDETEDTENDSPELNEEVHESALTGKTETFLQPNNSEFLILDDVHTPAKNNKTISSSSEPPKHSETLSNWRKILEDELKGDNHGRALRTQSSKTSEDQKSSDSNFFANTGIANERVYQLHDPPHPLYDSRGVPIKSENVPIHLHRYVPPTGVTSLPWKFSIPRPAPPRSIAIPPKPSTLT
ncbi:hypothetical protein JTE90_001926 [Oedothorax gibbosus]|uniref:Uncharacterized protein n=1 Tax=Oedothorax gibbosus TaxID=931172 RepID=A0AAV6VTQ0_9ARAC|nr:hypothetical protein JTE90_001926 [Oedothorax gibbosus]